MRYFTILLATSLLLFICSLEAGAQLAEVTVCTETIITGTETWNQDDIQLCNVIVMPKAELTIDGATIKMGANRYFDVRRGGTLKIINKAVVTALINNNIQADDGIERWEAIYVQADPSTNQDAETTGVVLIENSTIEFSRYGITTQHAGGSSNNASNAGALISCYESTFRNNGRSIELLAYPNYGNSSDVFRCRFFLDKEYLNTNGGFICHISSFKNRLKVWDDNQFYIDESLLELNEFNNERGLIFRTTSLTLGGNKISGFGIGVDAESPLSGDFSNIVVAGNKFHNNRKAVRLKGGKIIAFENSFNVYSTETTTAFGLEVSNSTDYLIEGNTFAGFPDITLKSEGLRVIDSGTDQNYVSENKFKSLGVGFTSEGVNSGNSQGLIVSCNEFDNRFNDISIIPRPSGSPLPLPGEIESIYQFHLSDNDSPFNTFTEQADNNISVAAGIVFPTSNGLSYNYPASMAVYQPTSVQGNVTVFAISGGGNSNSCNKVADKQSSQQDIEKALASTGNLRLFPNPTKGMFTIKASGDQLIAENDIVEVQVVSLTGRRISAPFRGYNARIDVDLSALPNGAYHVQLITSAGITNAGKVIKQ